MRSHSHWKTIVDNVEHANLQVLKQHAKQKKLRQKAYNHYLDEQVKQHQQIQQHKRQVKSIQKLQIENAYNLQYNKEIKKRAEKMKTQLNYQKDNLQILQKRKIKPEKEKFPEHPFIKLLDKEKKRLQYTKQKFQLQNYLNSIQEDMKKRTRMHQKIIQKKQRALFENHVQEQYQHRIQERKAFEKKYLTLNKYDRQLMQTKQSKKKNTSNEYLDFLSFQQLQHKKTLYEDKNLLDAKLQSINKDSEKPTASPAYLGRNSYSYDRGKQLEYIDRSLYYINKKQYKTQMSYLNDVISNKDKYVGQNKIKYLPSIRRNVQSKLSKQHTENLNPEKKVQIPNHKNHQTFPIKQIPIKQAPKAFSPLSVQDYKGTKSKTLERSDSKTEKKTQTKKFHLFDVITNSKKVVTMQTQIS